MRRNRSSEKGNNALKRKKPFVPAREKPAAPDEDLDMTLIHWMLSLCPEKRLQVLEQNVRSVLKLRDAKNSGRFFGDH
jgi:hypothetical protein